MSQRICGCRQNQLDCSDGGPFTGLPSNCATLICNRSGRRECALNMVRCFNWLLHQAACLKDLGEYVDQFDLLSGKSRNCGSACSAIQIEDIHGAGVGRRIVSLTRADKHLAFAYCNRFAEPV